MEIILRKDFDALGFEGDIVDVAEGYARNYLIPKSIAFVASPQNIKAFEAQRNKINLRKLKAKEDAEKVQQKLQEITIPFSHKAGEDGKLYGAVTSSDIASYLGGKGIEIDRKKIVLEKPIKALGEFEVQIKIYPEVTALIKVIVEPEDSESKD